MSNFYFNSNLPGLINELRQYKSEEDIMQFICGLDFLNKYLGKYKNPFKFEKNIIDNLIIKIGEFLMDVYAKKLKKELNSGEITKDEFTKNVIEYYCSALEIANWAYGERINFKLPNDSICSEDICRYLTVEKNNILVKEF